MFNQITIEKIERETDKAILIQCEVECCAGRKGQKVWFPKSRTKVEGDQLHVEPWLIKAKLEDLFGNSAGSYWFN